MSSIHKKNRSVPARTPEPIRRLQALLANERPPGFYSADELRAALREVVRIEAAPWTTRDDGSEPMLIDHPDLAGFLSAWLHLDEEEGAGPDEFEASEAVRDALACIDGGDL